VCPAAGFEALKVLVPGLRRTLGCPCSSSSISSAQADSYLPVCLNAFSPLTVKEAEDKEPLRPGVVYVAPPDYHLLVEADATVSLSVDPKVNFSGRPWMSSSRPRPTPFGPKLVGVVLTGANHDGAAGLARIKRRGGLTIVQSPGIRPGLAMPQAAIDATAVDHILSLHEIAPFLNHLIGPCHDQRS
jgi:two-component system, chemotaxis family, protein-glutamate methylesterase/glutaminase